ncbi:hypothetical protein MMA231_01154 [Asticcacaulis sp. MM231]|uniref:hypothetical protein n=1 Tax=Asticcacaulis sp. MM231 TaxID=3157666 RepID=UPI0032D58490
MGLEAESEVRVGRESHYVKALLESRDLIFRGAFRKTLPIADLKDPRIVNDALLFEHEDLSYALALPAGQASKWLKKLTTAPPTLAAKLGIDSDHRAFVTGHVDDAALEEALLDAVTTDPLQAAVSVIIARAPDELSAALAEVTQRLPHAPIWVVYPKGPKSPLPDSTVRTHMHALNLIDTKSSAVSDRLTATRFSLRKAR